MPPKRTKTPDRARRAGETSTLRGDVTVAVDIGGGSLKLCVAEDGVSSARVVPNAAARVKNVDGRMVMLYGARVGEARDVNGLALRRPVDRGFVVNWELQREILDDAFRNDLRVDPKRCDVIVTEPPFALPKTREGLDAMLFEHFGFRRAATTSSALATKRFADRVDAYKRDADDLSVISRSAVVVDCGFSFAHATAIVSGREMARGIRRLNLGGKALTNYLKELVSFRQWNMMDESVVIEDVKEKMCYVADDALVELEKCKARRGGTVRKEYVLPDGIHILRGYVREDDADGKKPDGSDEDDDEDEDDEDDDDFGARGPKKRKPKKKLSKKVKTPRADQPDHQFLTLVNERFMVPETLFHPSDIGARQCGVPELVAQALETKELGDEQRALCYMDVILTGGCASFPNFVERFERELRPLVSETYAVRVRRVEDPITAACAGCVDIAMDRPCFEACSITKEEYLANKAKIQEAHASLDFAPETRTGRLREYAAQPSDVSTDHIDSECARLTPSLEKEVIPAEI